MYKKLVKFSIILVLLFVMSGMVIAEEAKEPLIGIVMPVGGLGDLSFSWMAQLGIEKINKEKLPVALSTVEPSKVDMLKSSFKYYVDNGAKLIIGIGYLQENAIKELAEENPNVKFAIIDAVIDLPNVTSITFREDEGSFLAGSVSAMVSKTKKIGFIGAMDIPLIKKFKNGYEEGAKYIDPNILIEVKYIGENESAFASPDKAKDMAKHMYDSGIDIIFTAAGGSGLGVIDSARINDKYCIGVDSDQDYLAPGNVVTSMMKRVDNALYLIVEKYANNDLKSGHIVLGLKEGGVSLTEFRYSGELLGDVQLQKLEQIKKDIIDGKIIVK